MTQCVDYSCRAKRWQTRVISENLGIQVLSLVISTTALPSYFLESHPFPSSALFHALRPTKWSVS